MSPEDLRHHRRLVGGVRVLNCSWSNGIVQNEDAATNIRTTNLHTPDVSKVHPCQVNTANFDFLKVYFVLTASSVPKSSAEPSRSYTATFLRLDETGAIPGEDNERTFKFIT